MSDPQRPEGVIGGQSVWPYAHLRLSTGRVVAVAVDVTVGVVAIEPDGSAWVKLYGGSGETFWERYAQLRVGGTVEHEGHTVQLAESNPDGVPRPWVRLVCT
jgi:hypothetical protein